MSIYWARPEKALHGALACLSVMPSCPPARKCLPFGIPSRTLPPPSPRSSLSGSPGVSLTQQSGSFKLNPDHFTSLPQTKCLHFPITTGEHGSRPRPGHRHLGHLPCHGPGSLPCGEPSNAAGSVPLSHTRTCSCLPSLRNGLLKRERYTGSCREQKSEIKEIRSPSECAKISRLKLSRTLSKQNKRRVSTNRHR